MYSASRNYTLDIFFYISEIEPKNASSLVIVLMYVEKQLLSDWSSQDFSLTADMTR